MECIWSIETGFGSYPDHKRSRSAFSAVLDVLSTVSAWAGNRSVRVSWYARFTRVRSPTSSTQLRKTRTSSTVLPPVPTTVVDPKQSADSKQIRVVTIALHTEQENTRNLQEVQVSQRRTLSFLAGQPSPLMGWPPFLPWLLQPLIRAANGPNSAISLKQTFNRILYRFCNRQCLGVQKAKNGDRGTIVYSTVGFD